MLFYIPMVTLFSREKSTTNVLSTIFCTIYIMLQSLLKRQIPRPDAGEARRAHFNPGARKKL